MTTIVWTWIGLVLSCLGIVCAGCAYGQTWQEHSNAPLMPRVAQALTAARTSFNRLVGRRTQVINVSGTDSGHMVETATVLVVGTAMPGDSAPIEEQVRVLISRLEGAERQAQADRLHHAEDVQTMRTELTAATSSHEQANERLEGMTRSVAIGTVKLQLLGLILVGLGTVCLALPVLFG